MKKKPIKIIVKSDSDLGKILTQSFKRKDAFRKEVKEMRRQIIQSNPNK